MTQCCWISALNVLDFSFTHCALETYSHLIWKNLGNKLPTQSRVNLVSCQYRVLYLESGWYVWDGVFMIRKGSLVWDTYTIMSPDWWNDLTHGSPFHLESLILGTTTFYRRQHEPVSENIYSIKSFHSHNIRKMNTLIHSGWISEEKCMYALLGESSLILKIFLHLMRPQHTNMKFSY